MQIVGAIFCTLAGLRLLQSIAQARRTSRMERERSDRQLALLNEQIAATRALRLRQEDLQLHWNGYRKFRVKQKVFETKDVCSFYLVPHDAKRLPVFRPGQFITLRIALPGEKPGESTSVVRCYSLSDSPRPEQFRITVKRVAAIDDQNAPGVVSNHLHDKVEAGDLLDIQAPRGDFAINPEDSHPIVLIAGGIGVTPLLSMARSIFAANTSRDVWLFYGTRNGRECAMQDQLQQLNAAHESFRLITVFSDPLPDDRADTDFDHTGHINVSLLRDVLKVCNYHFYVCGPPAMMASLVPELTEWGVHPDRIHTEAFGPAAVRPKQLPAVTGNGNGANTTTTNWTVEFVRAGRERTWSPDSGSLLDFAEQHGVAIDSGCRAGSCGSCEVAIRSGSVKALSDGAAPCADGTCLACVSIPDGPLCLDV